MFLRDRMPLGWPVIAGHYGASNRVALALFKAPRLGPLCILMDYLNWCLALPDNRLAPVL